MVLLSSVIMWLFPNMFKKVPGSFIKSINENWSVQVHGHKSSLQEGRESSLAGSPASEVRQQIKHGKGQSL